MPLTHSNAILARIAYNQYIRGPGVPAPGVPTPGHSGITQLEEAEFYVDMAIANLQESTTYDPETYAPAAAEEAIIEYVRLRLLTQVPEKAESYNIARRAFAVAAAREAHLDHENTYPNSDDDVTHRRIRRTRYRPQE